VTGVAVTLFHDFTSPASAIAVLRAQRVADEGSAIDFTGFEAIGLDIAVPVSLDVKAAVADLARAAEEQGLQLRAPPALPPTGRAHVLATFAEASDLGAAYREAVYRAFWEDGADLDDASALVAVAESAGLDPGAAAAVVADKAALFSFRRQTAAHRHRGVGGVPTVLAQRTLVPGLLPLEDLRRLAALG
jgi:2-hydroxychromene-2-carboxylate isomerase